VRGRERERDTSRAIKDLECRTWRVYRVNVICDYIIRGHMGGYLVRSADGMGSMDVTRGENWMDGFGDLVPDMMPPCHLATLRYTTPVQSIVRNA
jgi:hypothetical protein